MKTRSGNTSEIWTKSTQGSFEIVGVTEDTQYRDADEQDSANVLPARGTAGGL